MPCRDLARQLRAYEFEQALLENVRSLWRRYQEKNAREVDEMQEKLRSLGTLTALLAGFSVTAFFSFGFDERSTPTPSTMFYALFTATTVRHAA